MLAEPASLSALSFPLTPACPGQKIHWSRLMLSVAYMREPVIIQVAHLLYCAHGVNLECGMVFRATSKPIQCFSDCFDFHEHAWGGDICCSWSFLYGDSTAWCSECPSRFHPTLNRTICEDDYLFFLAIFFYECLYLSWVAPSGHSRHSCPSVEITWVNLSLVSLDSLIHEQNGWHRQF